MAAAHSVGLLRSNGGTGVKRGHLKRREAIEMGLSAAPPARDHGVARVAAVHCGLQDEFY